MELMMVFFSAILSKRRNFKQKIWLVYLARIQRLIESNNISENIFQLKLIYMRLAKIEIDEVSFQDVICKNIWQKEWQVL